MSIIGNGFGSGGHYDKSGKWIKTKHCFASCGSQCDCTPPNGIYQKNVKAEATERIDKCSGCNGNGMVGNILNTDYCPFCKGSGIDGGGKP
jgi:hypothetical protein